MSTDGIDGHTPRRTFAIISHPDAGKTTLTEKLLLYGGAIHLAGAVRASKARRHATSDWMDLEKQRGISITSSVMQFPYAGTRFNLLDTPGHQDFSEDTYRTLTAADCAVMLIDVAKGVEAQTRKLFQVCRLRNTPIVTFMNKLDRPGQDPFDLMTEVEQLLGIRCVPITWPIGMGPDFKGVFDRETNQVLLFQRNTDHGASMSEQKTIAADDPKLEEILGESLYKTFKDESELVAGAGEHFDEERFAKGEITPVFWGSAMTNFGVEPFLEKFHRFAPPPGPRSSSKGLVQPADKNFSAFIFKVQANMDKAHRDRVAFMRVCSGKFTSGMWVRHARLGKEVRLSRPQQFFAQERSAVDEAWPGDVLGVFDPGMFRIGDTLLTGENFFFDAVPRFSPEHFARLRAKDPSRRKQFIAGLSQPRPGADSGARRGGTTPVRGAPAPAGERVQRGGDPRAAALPARPLGARRGRLHREPRGQGLRRLRARPGQAPGDPLQERLGPERRAARLSQAHLLGHRHLGARLTLLARRVRL
jgi:peptide chain release factor 3